MWMEEDQDVMVDETGANAEGQGTFAQSGSGQATEGDFSLAP